MSRSLLPLLMAAMTIDPNEPEGIPLTDDSPDDLDVAGPATWDLLDEDGDVIETVSGNASAVKDYGEEIGAVEMVEVDEEIGRRTREERQERRENEGGLVRRVRRKSLEKRLDKVNKRQAKRQDDDDDDDNNDNAIPERKVSKQKSSLPDWLPAPPPGARWTRSTVLITGSPGALGTFDYSQTMPADGYISRLTTQGTLAGTVINYLKQGEEFLFTPTGGAPVEPFTADGEFTKEIEGKRFERALPLIANVTAPGAGSVRLFFTVFVAKSIPCN